MQGFDHRLELALDGVGLGQGTRIGFVGARAITEKGKFVEQMRGRGSAVMFGSGIVVGEGEGAVVA